MYLEKLKIFGFKSFAKKTTIDLTPGVTGIVGPNGCGKSNIVDALRWVLGEQKAGTLRSERMESVIFNGAKDMKPMGMAEVSLTIKNTKNVDAVFVSLDDESLDHVVGIVPVTDHVLAAQQHLERRLGHFFFQQAQALPRIFAQKAHARVKGRAAPHLDRAVADGVDLGSDGQHIFDAPACRQQRLVRVAQRRIGYLEWIFTHYIILLNVMCCDV